MLRVLRNQRHLPHCLKVRLLNLLEHDCHRFRDTYMFTQFLDLLFLHPLSLLLFGLVVVVHDYLISHCVSFSRCDALQIDTQNAFPDTILPQDSPCEFLVVVVVYTFSLLKDVTVQVFNLIYFSDPAR